MVNAVTCTCDCADGYSGDNCESEYNYGESFCVARFCILEQLALKRPEWLGSSHMLRIRSH